jgi:DNA processing protein
MLSEFAPDFTATKWSFTQRNRIMAGISHATLIIEAGEKSGTLITARMATDYNRELLVVPGNIFSQNSAGPHQFLKLGATPVTTSSDILYALGFSQEEVEQKQKVLIEPTSLTDEERLILQHLHEPTEKDTLIRLSNLPPHIANALLMQMEMKGLVVETQNQYRRVL